MTEEHEHEEVEYTPPPIRVYDNDGTTDTEYEEMKARVRLELGDDFFESADYSEIEKASIFGARMMRQANQKSLAAFVVTGRALSDLKKIAASENHPELYRDDKEIANTAGVSTSVASDSLAAVEVILPYVEENLGATCDILEGVSVSNLRLITPVLKTLITGHKSRRASINSQAQAFLDEVTLPGISPEEKTAMAVEIAIQKGQLSNREAKKALREAAGTVITPMHLNAVQTEDGYMVFGEIDHDAMDALQTKFSEHFEVNRLPGDGENLEEHIKDWTRRNA